MLIKDLINKLEEVYQHDLKYLDLFGEPTIHMDTFKQIEGAFTFNYSGISDNIEIVRDPSGVYNILSKMEVE